MKKNIAGLVLVTVVCALTAYWFWSNWHPAAKKPSAAGTVHIQGLTALPSEDGEVYVLNSPTAPACPEGHWCSFDENDGEVWIHCNAGMEVKDLRNCPEYRRRPSAKEKAYDELVLDHSTDFYDKKFVTGPKCTDRQMYRQLQCDSYGPCNERNRGRARCDSELTFTDESQRGKPPVPQVTQ